MRRPPTGRFGVVGGVMIESEDEVERRFSRLVVSLLLLFWLFLLRSMTIAVAASSLPSTGNAPLNAALAALLLLLLH